MRQTTQQQHRRQRQSSVVVVSPITCVERCIIIIVISTILLIVQLPDVMARNSNKYMDVSYSTSSSSSSFLRTTIDNFNDINNNNNVTARSIESRFMQLEAMREFRAQLQRERERKDRRRQTKEEKRRKMKEVLEKLPKAPVGDVEYVSSEEWDTITAQQKRRGLSWFGDSNSGNPYSDMLLADPGAYYDKWAQAYRMIGGFIDCDHAKSANSHDNGNNNNNNNANNGACSRWMMWAAYVNPNYQGNGYDEYFGSNPTSVLDCHNPDSTWQLLGVYRQEFYQYVEQISKHLWAIDEYEYVVALAGLSYMTKYECFYVGKDNSGNSIYAGVAPKPYGTWQMALYTDGPYCLTPNDDLGMTYDSFGLTSDLALGSKDNGEGNNYDEAQEWWSETQEYTFTKLNDVYEEFKYCTSCVDYPTYQDGYFIGDYGTDDDDLINQCWKFYSHSSYTCEADCIAMAHAQGTIMAIEYGDTTFGKSPSSFYSRTKSSSSALEQKFSRFFANAFVITSFMLFVATFLAFAVARRSRYRESRSSKSRRLLDTDDGTKRSRSVRRSKGSSAIEGDGLFRSPSSARSKSRAKSKSRGTGHSSRSKSYDAPKERSSSSRRGHDHHHSSTRNSPRESSNNAAANSGDYF